MLNAFSDGGSATYRMIDEARIVDMLVSGGWPYEVGLGDPARALAQAQAALDRCVALGLAFQPVPGGARLFDAAEVMNFVNWAGINRLDSTWQDHFVATGRRMALDMYPGAPRQSVPSATALPARRFSISIEREFDLRSTPSRARIRLRLPLPIEDAALSDLKITVQRPDGVSNVELARGIGRLDATLRNYKQDRVSLRVRASFTARALPAASAGELSAADRDLYTHRSEGLVQLTSRIQSLCRDLSGSIDNPLSAVERFWRFVIETMICSVIRYDQVPAQDPLGWVLDRGWCDCQLGCALLVALCRARGIPARLNSGYLLYPVSPRYHYWAEAWLEQRGWLPFDLSSWGLSVAGQHEAWRDYFFGALDYRCLTQRLPRLFTGTSPVRLPRVWQMLTRSLGNGCETGFWSPETKDFVLADRIWIHEPELDSNVNAGPLPP
jgi:Transglutaminase-like superfamily